jgi:hypothetical protein
MDGVERMSEVEHQQLWLYHMVIQRYRIPFNSVIFSAGGEVSSAFIEDFVKTYAPKELSKEAVDLYYNLKRLRYAAKFGTELEMMYKAKLKEIGSKVSVCRGKSGHVVRDFDPT